LLAPLGARDVLPGPAAGVSSMARRLGAGAGSLRTHLRHRRVLGTSRIRQITAEASLRGGTFPIRRCGGSIRFGRGAVFRPLPGAH
jgi:hypothetical protein